MAVLISLWQLAPLTEVVSADSILFLPVGTRQPPGQLDHMTKLNIFERGVKIQTLIPVLFFQLRLTTTVVSRCFNGEFKTVNYTVTDLLLTQAFGKYWF